jgi:hypothetical protein
MLEVYYDHASLLSFSLNPFSLTPFSLTAFSLYFSLTP